jgi:hypothetical protein
MSAFDYTRTWDRLVRLHSGCEDILVRCYYHQEREAVGFCKSCNKGLCPHCLVDLDKGLACRGRCEADVRGLILMNEVNVAIAAKVPAQLRANRLACSLTSWFLLSAGVVFLLLGALNYPEAGSFLLLGGLFVSFGLLGRLIVARMPRFDRQPASLEGTSDRSQEHYPVEGG